MNCVKAVKQASVLLDHLLVAVKEAGQGRRASSKSHLADAALSAVEVSRLAPAKTKALALRIAREAAGLTNRPGQPIPLKRVLELRDLAKELKRDTELRCRI